MKAEWAAVLGPAEEGGRGLFAARGGCEGWAAGCCWAKKRERPGWVTGLGFGVLVLFSFTPSNLFLQQTNKV